MWHGIEDHRNRTAPSGISGTEGARKERMAHSRDLQREVVAWSSVTDQPEVTPVRINAPTSSVSYPISYG